MDLNTTMIMPIAFAFDLFGTLVQASDRRDPYKQLVLHFQAQGVSLKHDHILSLMTQPLSLTDAWHYLAPTLPINLRLIGHLEEQLRAELHSISPFEDALEALDLLIQKKIAFTYCSNLALPYQQALRLLPKPTAPAILSFECGLLKPNTDIFKAVSKAMNLPSSSITFFGDRICDDIEGARAAGMQACLVDRKTIHDNEDTTSHLGHCISKKISGSIPSVISPRLF